MAETPTVLVVLVSLFLLMETANVAALYAVPGSRRFNAVGVFVAWEQSAADRHLHDFVRYLVLWVAGTKVIFIALWLVILLVGDATTQLWASIVMVPAIATFYWRLFPIIRGLDADGLIRPAGYSRLLGWMIATFLAAFVVAIVAAL